MGRPTLELSMIVKDGAATLERCLQSAAPVVDRIVIGDTGSTDNSAAIARRFGAEVIAVPWEQDFARARNAVLQHGQCDWALVLDADEMLDDRAVTAIESLIARQTVAAYDVWRWNYVRESHIRSGDQAPKANPGIVEAARSFPAYVLSLNTRLFRRHPKIYFEGCVHETVAGRLEKFRLPRAQASAFVIHHLGQGEDSTETRQRKNELYQELGLKKLEANPHDPRASYELGLGELEHYRRPAEALKYFELACELDPKFVPAWLYAGICLVRLNRLPEAKERLSKARRLGPRTAVLEEAFGDACFHSGHYEQATHYYASAQALGCASALTKAKLGASEVCIGLVDQGLRRLEMAVASEPEFSELYDILVAAAVKGGKLALAAEAAEKRLTMGSPEEFHFQIAVELRACGGG
jgi:tetratricopeptide (TPR) repeat protein